MTLCVLHLFFYILSTAGAGVNEWQKGARQRKVRKRIEREREREVRQSIAFCACDARAHISHVVVVVVTSNAPDS